MVSISKSKLLKTTQNWVMIFILLVGYARVLIDLFVHLKILTTINFE